MKAKLLKIIRNRFTIIQYWDHDSVIMVRNKKTRFVSYHSGKDVFKLMYETVCWQIWNTFDYRLMWGNRIQARRQRALRKQFETKRLNNENTN